MQILLCLGALLVFFLLCGMFTTGKAAVRGTERMRAQLGAQTKPFSPPVDGGCTTWLADVNGLFALYQCGALTRDEFDEAKRHLLARLKSQSETDPT
jgi:hypothetical protein